MYRGLYQPSECKDNCGFGLIAHIKGQASHHLLQTAIESLTCMTHRGGIAADGKTGDGCGLLLQKPDLFCRSVAKETFGVDLSADYGVGMIFLNQDSELAEKSKACLDKELRAQNLNVIGWRVVPTNHRVCGPIALESLPQIEQVFVDGGKLSSKELSVKLFIARRKCENQLTHDESFYVCSLSNQVVLYKGLMLPADLPNFYPDLSDARMQTAICVYHQRFSTNTLPRWPLAHPFRFLAHNGEINTIQGNRNWSVARTPKFANPFIPNIDDITPLINRTGSDSSSMDNMLELLLMGGMDIFRAVRMIVPPAWQNGDTMDADLRAFYECNSMHMEPWDGPAGLVLTDGRYAVCMLDRNGLRPSRWIINKNNYINVASEIGVYNYKPEDVVAKGRIGPGQILAVDTQTGEILHTHDIDTRLKTAQPYKKWLAENAYRLQAEPKGFDEERAYFSRDDLRSYMKMFQVTSEERTQIFRPLGEDGQEAVGSMGDDTPMAVLSHQVRSPYDYFRQQFAQVTNPPIDPLREAVVMSLETCLGAERNVFEESPEHAGRVILATPVLSAGKFKKLLTLNRTGFDVEFINLNYDPHIGLKAAIETIADKCEKAVRHKRVILVLSDRHIKPDQLPIHAAMATGAIHQRLTITGLRCESNIIVETATARDPHHFAVLLGLGATAVYPYLSYAVLDDLVASGEMLIEPSYAHKNYRKGINKGLMKIISKMGISTIASYRGSQLFEAIGIHSEVMDLCFKGVPSRIEGARFAHFQHDQQLLANEAWSERKKIQVGGLHKFVYGGEYHAFNPDVVKTLQEAVQAGDYAKYKEFAALVNNRPAATLRDLLSFDESKFTSISIDEVEPLEAIQARFDSAAMSLGALSPEAHEALATAMNRIGGRSNSGEGGEDPARYGTQKNSKIKQVASGRFGVTPAYLRSAEVLQIKIAQGAKPGEGGQLPGGKVNELIATLRYCEPGVTLISPPPHHDIYSIEDLAQLIFDLKQVNPGALVSVKLVSEPGVGTVATGVAKAYADLITISGYDGGTGASPITSIRHAGSPWELGLSEAQQALRANHLRGKVRVQTDGGLKTGLDVIKAAILGAESFGFGTTPMVALGCKYLRICHLNNCATGVATQNKTLRDNHFNGTVEMVINFFQFVAQETREWLALLGVKKLEDMIGRTDLFKILPGQTDKHQHLDLTPLLKNDSIKISEPQFCQQSRNAPFDKGVLAEKMLSDTLNAIENKTGGEFSYAVSNSDRSIGTRLSGEIAARHGNLGMCPHPITLKLTGTAGQSLGVWNAGGLHIYLEGDANDYVGKGMTGGKIIITPPKGSTFKTEETSIIGNTCLYGATGGWLFAAGGAGERFGVRNSGAQAVVESVGDHCCEYMTGGIITVLGRTGYNFGAGMTGGFAYVLDVLDEKNYFFDKCNHELIELHRINGESMESYRHHLHKIISEYVLETNSAWGKHILDNFADFLRQFWLIKPKAASISNLMRKTRARPE